MRVSNISDFDDFDESGGSGDGAAPRGRRRRPGYPQPVRRGRLTERERARLVERRDEFLSDRPPNGDRWSTWDRAEHGPEPRPDWVITSLSAEDTECGVLKTGKEADVHLLRRSVEGGAECLLAAKRYRADEHRDFHRDAQYLEGRRMRRSRENRAMANRSSFGRNLIAEQWAAAEFTALCRLWSGGVPVPYPVQRDGTELLIEFIGSSDGVAAPRLAELRPAGESLRELWSRMLDVLVTLAGQGMAHGDLSAYNVLVHEGEPVLIDLPQMVDVLTNPKGDEFMARDVWNITSWFAARGLPPELVDPSEIMALLLAETGIR